MVLVSIIILLALSSSVLFSIVYKDQIKEVLIGKLNEQLSTEVKVGTIDLSLWSHFPSVALTLQDVKIKESIPGSKQNFAQIKKLHLMLDLFKIFSSRYVLEKILVEDATLNFKVNFQGKENYIFWKTNEEGTKGTSSSEGLNIDLKSIVIKNTHINYSNELKKQQQAYIIDNAEFSGALSSGNFTMNIDLKGMANSYQIEKVNYVRDLPLQILGQFSIDKNKGIYLVKDGKVDFGDIQLNFNGDVKDQDNGSMVDLKISGEKNNLKELIDLLPEEYGEKMKDFNADGDLTFSSTLKGTYSKSKNPRLDVAFSINDGELERKHGNEKLKNLFLNGSFTNGNKANSETSFLEVKDLKASLNDRDLKGNFSINNFTNPYLNVSFTTNADLKDVQAFLQMKQIKEAQGTVFLTCDFAGRINDLKESENINNTSLKGKLILNDVKIVDKDDLKYDKLNGNFRFNGNDLIVDRFSGYIDQSDFLLNGIFQNLSSFIFLKNQKLFIKASLESKYVNLENFFNKESETQDTEDSTVTFSLPDDLALDLNLKCNKIEYKKFKAEKIAGNLKYDEGTVNMNDVIFQTMLGKMVINGKFTGVDSKEFMVDLDAGGEHIDINQLFYQFDEFGQDFITSENLGGYVNADVHFISAWRNDLSADLDKLKVDADVLIQDGKLVNFEPITEMAGFIKLKKLANLKFDKLQNHIEIKDRKIVIPQMEINSSEFDMSVAGVHYFDNRIDYQMRINISEILFGKKEDYESEFGHVEYDDSGNLNLYLTLTGTADDLKYKYDKLAVTNKIKNDISKEGKELKDIFTGKKKKKTTDEYELIWDD